VLTDEQISALDGRVDEFRAASYRFRERIARDFFRSFKNACPQGVKFDEVTVETVRAPSAALGYSYTILAYSPASLWQNQTGNEQTCFQTSKSDG
jgi:hypothetical protein